MIRVSPAAHREFASVVAKVCAEEGVVYLEGKPGSHSMIASILDAAGKVEGVREVERPDLN